ncbi:MAG: M23 family metallopeptidase [Rickettsiales bacterium]|nr:M23 family metallopeptidase [Rickettsiales bacterium]
MNINKVEKPFLIAQLTPIAKPNSFSFKQDGETVSYREKKAAITVKQGDTLGGSLGKLRVENEDIFAISRSFKEVFRPERLKVNDKIFVHYKEKFINGRFDKVIVSKVRFQINDGSEYESSSYRGKFYAYDIDQDLTMKPILASGVINNSLYNDAIANNVPIEVILSYIKLFSYDLDFQRDIRKGDKFKIFYETYLNNEGEVVKYGDLIFSSYQSKSNKVKIENYRYINSDGDKIYLDQTGKSIKKSLLRTPVNGARISSGFGYRRHPILGYTKLHKGIDFAAPLGTPVYAAGSGKIKYAGWFSSYGKYVKIEHGGSYNTAYAHLSKIPKSIKKGKRVKQGDIIGYVGSTGRSTGPHLHYEVYHKAKAINPNKVKIQPQKRIQGNELALFQSHRDRIDFIMLNSYASIE